MNCDLSFEDFIAARLFVSGLWWAKTGAETQLPGCYMSQWNWSGDPANTPGTWVTPLANQRAGSGGHWPIRGQQVSWTDHPDCTNLSLVSSAPGSRVEFWQNIWTNSDMPHVIRHYFIQIGDNLTWDRPLDGSHKIYGQLSITIIAAFLPLCNCLAPSAHVCHLRHPMSHVTTLPDVTTPNAPRLPLAITWLSWQRLDPAGAVCTLLSLSIQVPMITEFWTNQM